MYPSSFLFIAVGLVSVVSSPSWLSLWVGMELSSIGLIPLFFYHSRSFLEKGAAWKFFVSQSVTSGTFLLLLLFNQPSLSLVSELLMSNSSEFLTIVMLIKMGVYPFHGWLVESVEGYSWLAFFVFSTILKVGPLLVIALLGPKAYVPSAILAFSVLGVSCIRETSLRKILVHSSILNISWACVSVLVGVSLPTVGVFFVAYSLTLLGVIFLLADQHIPSCDKAFSSFSVNFFSKLAKIFVVGSLCGLPPFPSFFLKLDIIKSVSETQGAVVVGFILLLSSTIMFISYLPAFSQAVFPSSKVGAWFRNPTPSTGAVSLVGVWLMLFVILFIN